MKVDLDETPNAHVKQTYISGELVYTSDKPN